MERRGITWEEYQAALFRCADNGQVQVSETRRDAMKQLVEAWAKEGGITWEQESGIKQPFIFAGSPKSRDDLSRMVQDKRAPELSRESIKHGPYRFHEGDRLYFSDTIRDHPAGTLGTITEIDKLSELVRVRLDTTEHAYTFRANYEPAAHLGYVFSLHRSMFLEYDRSFIFLDKSPYAKDEPSRYIEPPDDKALIFVDRENRAPECVDLVSRVDKNREQQRTLGTRQEEQQPEQKRTRKRGLEM